MYRLHVGVNLKWEKVNQTGDIPTGRHDHALCAVGCTLFLFGGKNDKKAFRSLQGVYSFDTRDDHWSLCPTQGSEPLALNPGIATVYHQLYVIGGIENRIATNEVDVFNTENLTWTKVTTSGIPPSPR
ncbi:kelch domain-containing protein 3-like [Amphiura filiformis]|uniref:kelch domain-containing protein 3-like n=1 Tax=Amphiura filiformis TaxID=82378 RepID=UPI003B221813